MVRYDYLWVREAESGQLHGKERPACIVAASEPASGPRMVVLLPITHSQPASGSVGIQIPAKVRRALSLGEEPSWVIVSEHNLDDWPSGGIVPLPGRPGVFSYGFVPPGLFATIKTRFIELALRGRSERVRR